jgi:hypothetical protein
MNRQILRSRLAAAGSLVLAAACSQADEVAGPASELASPRVSQEAQAPSPDDLDRMMPGFGGFFLDRNGTPTVYLTDAGSRGAAERALDGYLSGRGIGPGQLRVVRAQYQYRQLEAWYRRLTPAALAVDGAVFVDNDEANNRVRVGVEDLRAMGQVRAALAESGIPSDAVIIERAEPVVMMVTLRDRVRPISGGLQINFPGFLCTLGFNATSGSQASFITNSHCTNTQGGVEGTPYWQPLETVDPVQIATEVADPEYRRNIAGCPKGRRCRQSDASRAAYASGITFTLGSIARTTGANNGDLTISGAFAITAEDLRQSFTVGETLNKVGRTTGWTQGSVTQTCVNTGVSGTNIVQLCQTFVSAGVNSGDSGSPVFRITSGSNVALAGILWGGSGTSLFVFSPLRNIENELGALTTF